MTARATAVVGLFLCLPAAIMYPLLMLHIEPPFATLIAPAPADGPNVVGTVIAITVLALLPLLAFGINMAQFRRAGQPGENVALRRMNVVMAVVGLAFVLTLVVAIAIDQYPCWVGVPNCD